MTFQRASLITLLLAGAAQSLTVNKRTSSAISCDAIPAPEMPGINVTAVSSAEQYDIFLNVDSYYPKGLVPVFSSPVLQNTTINVCAVNVTWTHPGVGDSVTMHMYLPLENWNGRFQMVGGGGFHAGYAGPGLGPGAFHGYATANLDTPEVADPYSANPRVKNDLLEPITPLTDFGFGNEALISQGKWANFASRGLHEVAVLGKAVTESYYGTKPKYSYYAGCSTGGRQGYTIVQRYPNDFDGVLANAPGIFWNELMFSILWPVVPMIDANIMLTQCQLGAFRQGFFDACDGLDGVVDKVVGDVYGCPWEPKDMVGQTISCDGKDWTITEEEAEVARRVHEGPTSNSGRKLWFGHDWGTLMLLANTTILPNGTVVPGTNAVSSVWTPLFLQGNPDFDILKLTVDDIVDLFAQSKVQWGGSIDTDIADISAFRDGGGKLLTWHGLADESVPPNSTTYYRTLVEGIMGGNERVNDWYRVFMAPGAGHCGARTGHGPVPTDPFATLVDWVEKGIVPETISAAYTDASGTEWKKDLCPWPKVPKYDGEGDITVAGSYNCADSYQ